VEEPRERRHQGLLLRVGPQREVQRRRAAQQRRAVLAKVDHPVRVKIAGG